MTAKHLRRHKERERERDVRWHLLSNQFQLSAGARETRAERFLLRRHR